MTQVEGLRASMNRVAVITPLAGMLQMDRLDLGRTQVKDLTPLKRMTTADDIATLAVYLFSDAAKNLSGQCIAVTAGEPAL